MQIERRQSIANQVNAILLNRIQTQQYTPGSRLPSESELASEFGVSRASIRSALTRLAAQGLVIRNQGDGTYVNARLDHIPTRMGGMWNFIRLIENSGHQPSIHLLSRQVRPATEVEAQALSLQPDAPILALERVFWADTAPVILAHSAAPLNLLREPTANVDGELPVSEFVRRYYRTDVTDRITYTIFDVEATLPDAETRQHLQLEPGAPLLKLSQVFYDRANHPVFYSLSYVCDKVIRLRLAQAWE